MNFFPPIMNGRFIREEGFKLKNINKEALYNGKIYKEMTFEKNHGALWRIGQLGLAILASLTVIPLCIDFTGYKTLWHRAFTGIESKVILVERTAMEKKEACAPVKGVLREPGAEKKERAVGVRFDQARARVFDKEEVANVVANQNSQVEVRFT